MLGKNRSTSASWGGGGDVGPRRARGDPGRVRAGEIGPELPENESDQGRGWKIGARGADRSRERRGEKDEDRRPGAEVPGGAGGEVRQVGGAGQGVGSEGAA
ncbi:hypothetical protein ACHAWF_001753 [Thalassiosira exigua]